MSNLTVGQILVDAQRMVGRIKDLDALGSALLIEAEGNNRLVESLRQFQSDIDIFSRISNNKSNAEIVNRIHQQNANSSEILKENRELKICIEDYERALELIMQKYREHAHTKILETKVNFRDVYNEKLWKIIREQREKINEMAAVMHRAAIVDEKAVNHELEIISRLRLENKTLRELLQISKQFGSDNNPIRFNEYLLEEKAVQTDDGELTDDSTSSGVSVENVNNNSVINVNCSPATDLITPVTNSVGKNSPVRDNNNDGECESISTNSTDRTQPNSINEQIDESDSDVNNVVTNNCVELKKVDDVDGNDDIVASNPIVST